MKKQLMAITIACLCLFQACKKNSDVQETVTITVSNVNSSITTYNISFTDSNGHILVGVTNGNQNETFTISVSKGTVIGGSYRFTTQGQQSGQGNIDFYVNSQNFYHINGGNGGNMAITVP